MLFDTHVHFYSLVDVDRAVQRAKEAGVSGMIAVGSGPDTNRRTLELARAWPDLIWPAIGYNRDLAAQPPPFEELERLVADPAVKAIGEIGLDYHYEPQTREAQCALFERQLDLARRHGRPVIVHSREAQEDTVRLLTEHTRCWKGEPGRVGVAHCFTGDAGFARQLLDMGLMVSFSGIVTFRKSEALRAVARLVPADRLLIETDSPYLAPEPYRGQPNEPALVKRVAEELAAARNVPFTELAEATSANARRLFLAGGSFLP